MPTGKLDLKNLKTLSEKFTQNFDVYEKKVRDTVHQLDLRSKQARQLGEATLKEVRSQILKTRGQVERRVKGLVDEEAKKLNVRLREVYSYLVKTAQKEQSKSGKRKSSTPRKKASPRKTRAKAVASNENATLPLN